MIVITPWSILLHEKVIATQPRNSLHFMELEFDGSSSQTEI
jgi:hypothetical protein